MNKENGDESKGNEDDEFLENSGTKDEDIVISDNIKKTLEGFNYVCEFFTTNKQNSMAKRLKEIISGISEEAKKATSFDEYVTKFLCENFAEKESELFEILNTQANVVVSVPYCCFFSYKTEFVKNGFETFFEYFGENGWSDLMGELSRLKLQALKPDCPQSPGCNTV